MRVLLPYPSLAHSVAVCDRVTLGMQRQDCWTLLSLLLRGRPGDDAVSPGQTAEMERWRGHEGALAVYVTLAQREWTARGYQSRAISPYEGDWLPNERWWRSAAPLPARDAAPPAWLGDAATHSADRAELLTRAPAHYAPLGWPEAAGG